MEDKDQKAETPLASPILSRGLCACILCAQRSECMPGYDDETLIWGADNGHAPKADKECARHIKGDEDTRARALYEKKEFDEYASNLIKNFGA